MYRLTQTIMDKIKRMERTDSCVPAGGEGAENTGERTSGADEKPWEWIEEFVQVLLYYEIYKKRHVNHNGILKF